MPTTLFDPAQTVSGVPLFAGDDFDASRDTGRLTNQLQCILEAVRDERWRTITKLTTELRRRFPAVNFPENSVQAQLRNLRKLGYRVEKQNVAKVGYLCEYRVLAPVNPGVGQKMREVAQ